MRIMIVFLIAFITTSVVNAQQILDKSVRSSLTLTAFQVKGKFRVEQLSTAKNAVLRKAPVAVTLPAPYLGNKHQRTSDH
jgi:hypothetical protein